MDKAQALLVSCQSGINRKAVDIAPLDELTSPLLKQGESRTHIYAFMDMKFLVAAESFIFTSNWEYHFHKH